jgi:hypothetical protein
MPAFFRRSPRTAGLPVDPGERLLATATLTSGTAAATDRRLLIPVADGFYAIDWESVDRVSWDRDDESLLVVETAPMGSPARNHRLRFERPGRLLDVIREQVTASVVISRYVPVDGERGVRVTGRRRAGQIGLRWVVAVDAGLDLADPSVRGLVDTAVAGVRAEVE